LAVNFRDKLKENAVDLQQELEYLNAVIYGGMGMGKTLLSGSLSKLSKSTIKLNKILDGKVFMITAEKGSIVLQNKDFKDRIDLNNIKSVKLNNFSDFNDYYEFLFLHCELVKELDLATLQLNTAKIKKAKDKIWELENGTKRPANVQPNIYRFCVIDSLTEAQKRSLDRIVDIKTKEISEGVKGNITGKGIIFDTRTAATLPDHGVNTNQLRKLVRAFRDLDMHCIFLALEMEIKDEDTGKIVSVRPALTTKLNHDVCSYVNLVARLYTKVEKEGKDTKLVRKLLCQPYGNFAGKDGTGRLGIGMSDPTFDTILSKIYG
jgi:hypothetical protein